MTTNDKNAKSGFNCPTIGNAIPEGYKLVKREDGKWEIVKDERSNR